MSVLGERTITMHADDWAELTARVEAALDAVASGERDPDNDDAMYAEAWAVYDLRTLMGKIAEDNARREYAELAAPVPVGQLALFDAAEGADVAQEWWL